MDLKECLLVGFFCVLSPAWISSFEQFELSSSPIVISDVGEDALLPCQISLGDQPENMEIQWKKLGDNHDENIYHFVASQRIGRLGKGYLGKALLPPKEGKGTGNVSLMLKKVQISDGGIYKCIVTSSYWVAETETELHIAALGNGFIEVLGPDGDGIKLACKSAGWFPEPELQWLTRNSRNPQFESKQDHEQLFSVWSNITVTRDSGEIICSVHERSHLQRNWKFTIFLSEDIFPATFPPLWAFCISITGNVLAFIGFIIVLILRRCKEKQKAPKMENEEGEEQKPLQGTASNDSGQEKVQDTQTVSLLLQKECNPIPSSGVE